MTRSLKLTRTASAALLLAATTALTPALTSAQAATTPVTFAMSAWIGFAPLFVASQEKFFGAYPLKFVHMDTGINAAVVSGAADSADLSMNQVISDHLKGFDVKIVMPIDYSNGADAIVAKKSITSVAELRGQTIPLDTTSYSELLLAYALHQAKLSLADVKPTNMPASAVPAALLGGHAEAGVTWAPHIDLVTTNPGYHALYTSAEAPGLITDNFAVKTSFLKAHPGAIPAIIKGFLEGTAYIKSHPTESYAIIGKALGISPADAKIQYTQVINPTLADMKYMMTGKGNLKIIPYKTNVTMVRQLMITQGQMKPTQKIAEPALFDTKFVTEQ
ncbi:MULTISPECIES: ABC transporter substrate-binding protein [Acidiphilium]|uniref:NitT/TauT family transport system substrate-binding protein n=1 Tax=Acidiphilium rubrum TaxID=526 RepID=A0A8G2CL12_ACIRU|nr:MULTISPECIES: ABC transporter substrate-binding protein [Acidiphilium]SIQ61918.1 NitT/TauT family transport system substrate-binding protein [Acidiphilium rubrum]